MSYEVYSVDIIYIAVVIVINARSTVFLGCIYPHIVGQIWVVVLNHTVDNCNNNARITCSDIPSLTDIDICASLNASKDRCIANVDIVPLLAQLRVVKCRIEAIISASCRSVDCRCSRLNIGNMAQTRVILHLLNLGYRCKHLRSLVQIGVLVKIDNIPTVHTLCTQTILVLARDKETLDFGSANLLQNLIKLINT